MKYLILKDKKKRKNFFKFEIKILILKALLYNDCLDEETKLIVKNLINYYGFRFSKVFIKNRCIITGRSRSTLRIYKISRNKFRDFAYNGYLSGFIKL